MNWRKHEKLGEVLLAEGAISVPDLQRALKIQKVTKQRLGEILVDLGVITGEQLLHYLGEQLGLPIVALDRYFVSEDVISLLEPGFIRENEVMPLFVEGQKLHLAMVDPLDTGVIERIEKVTGLDVEVMVCSREGIKKCMAVHNPDADGGSSSEPNNDLIASGRVLRNLLFEMIHGNCSELHLDCKGDGMSIRMGWGRKLRISDSSAKGITGDQLPSIRRYLGIDGQGSARSSKDLCIVHVDGKELSIRICVLETLQGESMVFKPIPRNLYLDGLSGAGLADDQCRKCEDFLGHDHGFIAVSSPPGNGKTVTMYAMLKHLSIQGRSIYLLEDSALDVLDYACQVPVGGVDVNRFCHTLDRVRKHSPDVIAVDECADTETLRKLLDLSEDTLVLTTVVAHDFAETWLRITSITGNNEVVSAEFIGSVSQVLLRPFCRDCFDSDRSHGRDVCPVCGSYGVAQPRPVFQVVPLDRRLRTALENCYDSSSVDEVLGANGIRIMSEAIGRGCE